MAGLIEKIRTLKGKKIAISGITEFEIRKPGKDFEWYHEITEIGDDYFEAKTVFYKGSYIIPEPKIYSIYKLLSIVGNIEDFEKI